jgi:hypothetical protein
MHIGMDLWYPLILESSDLQQAAELNSTRNVNIQKVGQSFFHLSSRTTVILVQDNRTNVIVETIANYKDEPRNIPNL